MICAAPKFVVWLHTTKDIASPTAARARGIGISTARCAVKRPDIEILPRDDAKMRGECRLSVDPRGFKYAAALALRGECVRQERLQLGCRMHRVWN